MNESGSVSHPAPSPADRVWWHVYALGATGAPIREPDTAPEPRLRRLIPWLDQMVGLGLDGLLLGPVFASTSHGYDTLDHLAVDPRLGTAEDLDALLAAARERDIAVILDGVFNHVGADHPWVAQTLAAGPDGTGHAAIEWRDGAPVAGTFEGHDSLVALRHDHPETRAEIVRIMNHWLDRGIAGWRLDAAYAVPTEAWADIAAQVRAAHPDAWLLGEVIHGDYAGIVSQARLDTVTQYELWKSTWSSMLDHNPHELAWTLQRHVGWCESFVPATFVGNHDVTRIATTVGAAGAAAAVGLLMALPGTPFVYYGDEVGATGTKEERVGGDDAVRPALPASGDPRDWPGSSEAVLAAHREAIALRRAHPWITRGTLQVGEPEGTVLPFTVRGEGHELRGTLDCGPEPAFTAHVADADTMEA